MKVDVRPCWIYEVFCVFIMKEKPNLYAIIPANVRYDNRLKANEKLLYGEITALTQSNGKCWANNQYFAELYDVSKTSISKWIKNLIKFNYIKSVLIYKEGTKQILNRYITLVQYPIEEKLYTPIEEKLKDNNTSTNNTSRIDFKGLLDFINSSQGREGKGKFRVISKKVKSSFNARLKEGYLKENIINAITNVSNIDYHKKNKYQYATPEFFSRSDTLDKYGINKPTKKQEEVKKVINEPYKDFY